MDLKKIIINKNKYGKIISNFSYLSLLQISNLVIPIITYPILIKNLGDVNYGKVVYAQAILTYLSLLVNFGFNIIGTREISVNSNNPKEINKIVNGILQLKFLMFLVAVLLLFLYLFFLAEDDDSLLYFFSLWVCVNELILPVWYFQGIEKMRNITIISVFNKILILFLILCFIKDKNDYLYVPALNFMSILLSSTITFYFLYKDNIRFKIQPFSYILELFKKAYVMALTVGINIIKANMNVVLAKLFFSYKAVAYFDLAIKITNIFISFLDLISQSVYPKMSILKDKIFLKKILKYSAFTAIVLTLFMQLFSGIIVNILGGEKMADSIPLLRMLSVIFPIYIVGALLGRNALVVHGYNEAVLSSMIFSSFVYVMLIFTFYYVFHIDLILMSLAFILSFLSETIYRYVRCKKYNII